MTRSPATRTTQLLLTGLFAIGLAGCGDDDAAEKSSPEQTASTTAATGGSGSGATSTTAGSSSTTAGSGSGATAALSSAEICGTLTLATVASLSGQPLDATDATEPNECTYTRPSSEPGDEPSRIVSVKELTSKGAAAGAAGFDTAVSVYTDGGESATAIEAGDRAVHIDTSAARYAFVLAADHLFQIRASNDGRNEVAMAQVDSIAKALADAVA